MNEAPISPSFYKVGGALPQDVPSYVTRESDRELYEALKAGEFCYVLNCRQRGKSSLMVRTLARLQAENWAGIIIDFSAKDSQADLPDRWYKGIINQLNRQFKLLDRKDFRSWLKERDFISPVERLGEFIETVLLPSIEHSIVIFIDEIDSTLNLPFTDDFFALIRSCYNKRAENPNYQRLTFALFGVAAPSDLISDAKRTPFNIGKSIDLKGFALQEALPLAEGLTAQAENPQVVLPEILHWTGGQPFLTQRLCQLVVDSSLTITSGNEATMIQGLVSSRLIENWESQDHQEHLKTIRKRLLDNEQKAGYLLELYRQIRQGGEIMAHNRPEERELQLSGLVVKRDGKLQVYNPIYEAVFDEAWIDAELKKLRPYAESFRAWIASGKTDTSRLLRGEALAEAEQWAAEKKPSAEDREFLAACRTQQREEEIAAKEREAELIREKKAREAAEEAERIQAQANQKAQRRIRIGSIVLGVTLLGAIISTGLGYWQFQKTQTQLNRVEDTLAKTNKALEAVRELSKLAGKLRKKGEVEASDEALRKAGLSTLIENEELKQAWLIAATAEASQSFGSEGLKQAQETIKTSLDSLNNIQAQLDPRILHQVRAFAYFQAGKVKGEKYYQDAYDALKASNFDPFNPNIETDVLNEQDVENIHGELIKSKNIDINSETDPIAISFREHLYAGLEFLLKEDRLQAADQKTWSIMLYIAERKEERTFLIPESLENFSCDALEQIDKLWYDYPRHPEHFGFRVQTEIWKKNGSPSDDNAPPWGKDTKVRENYRKFWSEVGWKKSEDSWLPYPDLMGFVNVKASSPGNLPFPDIQSHIFDRHDLLYIRFSRCEL